MKYRNESSGDWIFKAVPYFIAGVFVLIVCGWIALAVIGSKALEGLKGCTPAVVTAIKDGQQQTSIECKK